MAFSPLARYRNFTVDNLKDLLDVYPDIIDKMTWVRVADKIEPVLNGYKKTAYQMACQLGLEDRGRDWFRIQSYLYAFEDSNLQKYVEFWIKTYYAPNPYVNSDDEPMLIYCELVKEILDSDTHEIDFSDFFDRRIGGKSEDILINVLKEYCSPLKLRKADGKNYFFIDDTAMELIKNEVEMIEREFSVENAKDKGVFFDRYSYKNFCKFHGIAYRVLPEANMSTDNDCKAKRETGGENIILYGVPGSGKSYTIKQNYCSDEMYIERVVFHPDYTFADFIGQILPRIKGDRLRYEFTPGPFTKIMKKAWNDPGHKYYLVIEEINRGNAPAIFGEIFQLLDRKDSDKYTLAEIGESEYGITNYDVAHIFIKQCSPCIF